MYGSITYCHTARCTNNVLFTGTATGTEIVNTGIGQSREIGRTDTAETALLTSMRAEIDLASTTGKTGMTGTLSHEPFL